MRMERTEARCAAVMDELEVARDVLSMRRKCAMIRSGSCTMPSSGPASSPGAGSGLRPAGAPLLWPSASVVAVCPAPGPLLFTEAGELELDARRVSGGGGGGEERRASMLAGGQIAGGKSRSGQGGEGGGRGAKGTKIDGRCCEAAERECAPGRGGRRGAPLVFRKRRVKLRRREGETSPASGAAGSAAVGLSDCGERLPGVRAAALPLSPPPCSAAVAGEGDLCGRCAPAAMSSSPRRAKNT